MNDLIRPVETPCRERAGHKWPVARLLGNAHLPGGDKLEEKNALINAGIEMSSLKRSGHV